MKEIIWGNTPDSNSDFLFQTTPPKKYELPKVSFPTTPKKVENGSKTDKGKTKGPARPKGQPTLWPK